MEVSMRFVLAFILCLFVMPEANAGAQFTIQNIIFKDLVPRAMIGLSIDQKIEDKLFISGWAGLGSRPDRLEEDESKQWASAKVGLDYRFERVSFGGGVQMNASSDNWETFYPQIADAEKEYAGYLKMSLKLW